MKPVSLILLAALFFVACNSSKPVATQDPAYVVLEENGHKVLKGLISRSLLENDSSFAWFKKNMQYGQPDAAAVEAFRDHASKFSMVVFGGTWCPDTQNLLPGFYKLVDKSGYPEKNITLIGVDRAKTTLKDLHTQYNISRVPTFIVLKDGKEVGRVVEYGSTGQPDKELGDIVRKSVQ